MTDFIDFEVSVEDKNKNEEKYDEASNSDLDSLKYFIDDDDDDDDDDNVDEIENDRIFYQKFENVTTCNVSKEEYDKSIVDIQKSDVSNFCETSEEEREIDEFRGTEKRIKKFKETLFPVSKDSDDDEKIIIFSLTQYFLQ